ncbi:MAG: hypothetical protein IKR65_03065 [Selenomonadaceae bacterium]|nr:hypothetical protein [Selenomonadaceae bacterium]MBR6342872.1 hypothetical protein [Selenomonadaceae bacterium]MBR6710298.1 hypothetical protein [Selenomonadaceae bacterium]MBR6905790.1 hypothetical protein [Selenomonadaceae bacterium]
MPQGNKLLEQLMHHYTKDDLLAMAHIKGIPAKSAERKAVIAEKVSEFLLQPDTLTRYLLWCEDMDFYHILAMAGVDVKEDAADFGEELPWGFLHTGYFFVEDDDSAPCLPDDVQELMRKIWSSDLRTSHRQHAWVRRCLSLGVQLYGYLPYPILARLLRQKVQYGVAVSALPQLLKDIPPELNPYGEDERGIYDQELEFLLPHLEFPAAEEDYYIPSAVEIENHIFYTTAFQAMMDQQEESLRTKYRQPFLNIRAIMLHLCALKALECQEYTMPDLIVMEGDPALCNADMGILTEMGTRLCVLFHKVDRHIRRICYHGFTYAEWETRNRTPSRALLTDAAQGAAPHIQQTAKVISLDEQRRQREKRNKK